MIPRWQICPDCGTLVIDGECWCTIGHRLDDEDLEALNLETQGKGENERRNLSERQAGI